MILTKKDLIVESIQKMNLSLLEVLLDNNKIYQGAKKELFLEKLGIAFDKLIKMGDTFLFAHEGICTCENPLRKGLKGYSFIGNNFNNCLDLIFIELTDDFKDIYNACCFEIFDKTIETAMKVRVDIKLDEKAKVVADIY